MSPQLSAQQLEHAISNLEKRVKAKKLECHSLGQFRTHAPGQIGLLLDAAAKVLGDFPAVIGKHDTESAVNDFLTARLNQGLIDLEELELTLRAYKQASSGIVGASLIPPSNSKMH